jgi:hypothetical protein
VKEQQFEGRDGQKALKAIKAHFPNDDSGFVNGLEKQMDSLKITGAENPETVLEVMTDTYNVLQSTTDAAEYTVKWFNKKVIVALSEAPIWSNFIENNREKIINSGSIEATTKAVKSHWTNNYMNSQVMVAMSSVKARCANTKCPRPETHSTEDCRFEGGAKEVQCYICKKAGRTYFGHGNKKYPCTYKKKENKNRNNKKNNKNNTKECTYEGCPNPKSHTTMNCFKRCEDLLKKKKPKKTSSHDSDSD